MKQINLYLVILFLSITACSSKENKEPDPNPSNPDIPHFAKGADISWATKMESEGLKFYNSNGEETECTKLMQQIGMNSVRFRVWVNPQEGWNNKEDVIVKANRAQKLGMRIMIDFHYSDTWADPGHQNPPKAWENFDLSGLKRAVTEHTTDVLSTLKENNVEVEWVQIGNETPAGMLLPIGEIDNSNSNFAQLINSGYDAVKDIYPNAFVIVHVDKGNDYNRLNYVFNYLKNRGGKYDMIGVSLYPSPIGWEIESEQCIRNIKTMAELYNKPTIICEVGMIHSEPEIANKMLSYLLEEGENNTNGECRGIFYWEPQAPAGYNGGYEKGAFKDGKPTSALEAFKQR